MDTKNNSLLISQKTDQGLQAFMANPSHAVLVVGALGTGKYAVALHLASRLLNLEKINDLSHYPYFYEIRREEGKQDISIDGVRELIAKLRLKTTGTEPIRRVVVIEDAQHLSHQAQNSLLKTLEEAPMDTVFILTSPSEYELLPTIVSRVQKLYVHPISLKESAHFFGVNEVDIRPNWLLSKGGAGLLSALTTQEATHPLKSGVERFKTFLGQNAYDRLAMLGKLEKNKDDLLMFCDAGLRILAVLHKDSERTGAASRAKKILSARKTLLQASQQLQAGASPRLVILAIVTGVGI